MGLGVNSHVQVYLSTSETVCMAMLESVYSVFGSGESPRLSKVPPFSKRAVGQNIASRAAPAVRKATYLSSVPPPPPPVPSLRVKGRGIRKLSKLTVPLFLTGDV